MKKMTYLLAAAALLTACGGNKGYTITGTVADAENGTTVYLQERVGRQYISLDSAVITDGKFEMKGAEQAETKPVYLTYQSNDKGKMLVEMMLENGIIKADLKPFAESITGTTDNDLYQPVRDELNAKNRAMDAAFTAMSDTTLSDEVRKAKAAEMDNLENQMADIAKAAIAKNITNPVGIYLLKSYYYYMTINELDPLMPQIPAAYDNDEVIAKIKENVAKMKVTAVGQKFTDFEMKTPDEKSIKLSDYVGKGKVVLIDFWASWCPPCRREMPNLVQAYERYKNKGFEIVGVSLDKTADAWKKGIADLHITWPQMSDLQYWNCEGAKLYAVSSIPHTVLIDGEGTIIARGLHGKGLQEKLAEVLK
jgi:peroxiredoxin